MHAQTSVVGLTALTACLLISTAVAAPLATQPMPTNSSSNASDAQSSPPAAGVNCAALAQPDATGQLSDLYLSFCTKPVKPKTRSTDSFVASTGEGGEKKIRSGVPAECKRSNLNENDDSSIKRCARAVERLLRKRGDAGALASYFNENSQTSSEGGVMTCPDYDQRRELSEWIKTCTASSKKRSDSNAFVGASGAGSGSSGSTGTTATLNCPSTAGAPVNSAWIAPCSPAA